MYSGTAGPPLTRSARGMKTKRARHPRPGSLNSLNGALRARYFEPGRLTTVTVSDDGYFVEWWMVLCATRLSVSS